MEISIKGEMLKLEEKVFTNDKGEEIDYRTARILTEDGDTIDCSVLSDLVIDIELRDTHTFIFGLNAVYGKDNQYKLRLVDIK